MNDIDWSQFTTADLIEAYAVLKQRIEEVDAKHKARMKEANEGLERIHTKIRAHMNQAGVNQIAVAGFGTAFNTTRTYYSASDWGKFCDHIVARVNAGDNIISVLSAFQKKPNKEYVLAWMEGHKGVPPPGISVVSENELQVRRTK